MSYKLSVCLYKSIHYHNDETKMNWLGVSTGIKPYSEDIDDVDTWLNLPSAVPSIKIKRITMWLWATCLFCIKVF